LRIWIIINSSICCHLELEHEYIHFLKSPLFPITTLLHPEAPLVLPTGVRFEWGKLEVCVRSCNQSQGNPVTG
jgi:hypothetical protein